MKCGTCCFKFKGIYYAFGTKLKLTKEAYALLPNKENGIEYTFMENNSHLQLLICMGQDNNGKTVRTLVPYCQIQEITMPIYWGKVTNYTQKLIDEQVKEKETGLPGSLTTKIAEQEKKSEARKDDFEENFNAWMIYIPAMLVATVFQANIFLWILFTAWFAIYKTYEHK